MSGKTNLTRFGEHEKAIFNGKWKDSALADHTRSCTGNVNWGKASTISIEPHYFQRCVRESLEIKKEQELVKLLIKKMGSMLLLIHGTCLRKSVNTKYNQVFYA